MSRTKVMISMPEEFLAEIDKAAKKENRNRSEFLREAARFYLEVRRMPGIPSQDPRVQRSIAVQNNLARHDTLDEWHSVAEIRKWRDNR